MKLWSIGFDIKQSKLKTFQNHKKQIQMKVTISIFKTTLLILLVLIFVQIDSQAQNPPDAFSYQAIVRDAEGVLVTEKPIRIRITIFHPGNGILLPEFIHYSETNTAETNENGLLTMEIGRGESDKDFATISWRETRPYFIRTEIDITNQGRVPNYTIQSSTQLLSVPFSLMANEADSAFHAERSDYAVNAETAVYLKGAKTYKIGDEYESDGIVFWVDETGQHGYACRYKDVSPLAGQTGFEWLSKEVSIYGTRWAIGTGHYNSILMTISNKGDQRYVPAAYVDYLGDNVPGRTDWFIPSAYELRLLYENKSVDPGLTGWYWSSHGYNPAKEAWAQNFDTGVSARLGWDIALKVRLIRKF